MYEKLKSVVLGAASGFTLGAITTGLVENPLLAVVAVSIIFLIILYFAKAGRKKRRR